MKKVFIGLLVVALLLGAGAYYLITNLDSIVQRTIEDAGTDALGTDVRVDSVAIDLREGTAILYGFTVANPEGFSNDDMIRYDQLRLAIDLASLRSDVIRINSITTVNPHVLYELQGTTSNLDAIRAGFPADPDPEPSGPDPVVAIENISITGIAGTLRSNLMSTDINVELGDISLPAAEGTPGELAQQLARPLFSQLARNAAAALGSQPIDQLLDGAGAAAGELQEQLERAEDAARSAAEDLRSRLGL